MEQTHPSPEPLLAQLPSTPATRHDGWSGEKMAKFCNTLAETAIVAEACDEAGMGISGAYALRRRNPLFAAAWDAALTIARERLADTLLARSIEGNVEQIWRNGEVVGERHVIDNRLGLAILRRLDRLAETGFAVSTVGTRTPPIRPACPERSRGAIHPASAPIDWDQMLDALRTGDPDAVAEALAILCPGTDEVEEVEDPPVSTDDSANVEYLDLHDRCWKQEIDGAWMTDFPPPDGFTGYQLCRYGDTEGLYFRACTPEEVAILEADIAADLARERAEQEELRDTWFALLKEESLPDEADRHAGDR